MRLNAIQKSYVDGLQNKYLRALTTRRVPQGLSTSHRLVVALEIIERANRTLVRRIGEYGFLVLNLLFHKLLNLPLMNISIGIYQVKLAHVFDFLDIQYEKRAKQLAVHPRTPLSTLLSVLLLANQPHTVDWILSRRFQAFKWDRLMDSELQQVATFYSGSVTFGERLDYLYVLKQLYSFPCNRSFRRSYPL